MELSGRAWLMIEVRGDEPEGVTSMGGREGGTIFLLGSAWLMIEVQACSSGLGFSCQHV